MRLLPGRLAQALAGLLLAGIASPGGPRLLCLHVDGTARFEESAGACCLEDAAEPDERAALAPGGCAGCSDLVVHRDLVPASSREDPASAPADAGVAPTLARTAPPDRASPAAAARARRALPAPRTRPIPLRV